MLNVNQKNRYDIGTVVDIMKVSIKCAEVVEKFISLDIRHDNLVTENSSKYDRWSFSLSINFCLYIFNLIQNQCFYSFSIIGIEKPLRFFLEKNNISLF